MAFVEYLQKFLCVCVLWVVKNLARLRAPNGTGWRKALLTKDRSVLEATQGIHCWWSADAFGLSSSVCASQKSVIFCSDAECRACLVGEANWKESMLRDRMTSWPGLSGTVLGLALRISFWKNPQPWTNWNDRFPCMRTQSWIESRWKWYFRTLRPMRV